MRRNYFFFADFFDEEDFFAVERVAVDFFEVLDFFDEDFFALDFFAEDLVDDDFFDEDFFEEDFFAGTFPPSRRASDNPMAMACLRLVTFLPEPPLFNFPRFISCMFSSTLSDAFFPYLLAIQKASCTARCASGVRVCCGRDYAATTRTRTSAMAALAATLIASSTATREQLTRTQVRNSSSASSTSRIVSPAYNPASKGISSYAFSRSPDRPRLRARIRRGAGRVVR
jgi:hypothetical protein